jgi:hypothetical protein
MYDHRNPFGASSQLLKEQELEDNLLKAEFAWNDSVTLEEKKKALSLVNSALEEIEKFNNEKKLKKPNPYFDVDPSLISLMMQEMEMLMEDKLPEKSSNRPEVDVKWDNQSWEEQRG